MADQKISQLNNITGANVDDTADELAIVDSSATQTKAITRGELFSDVSKITTNTAGADVAIKALRPANTGTGDPVVIVAGDGDAGDVLLEMRGNTDATLVDTADAKESADAKFIFYGNGASTFNGPLTLNSNATITGDLTVSGTTTTVNTQNLDVKDAVIALNTGQATPLNDIGMLFQRYASATASNYNVVMAWDESVDKLIFGSTAEDGSDNTITFVDEWMTITSGGNVGIGLTNPTVKLDVSGTAAARGNLVVGSDTLSGSSFHVNSTTKVTRAQGAVEISNALAGREGYLTLSDGTNATSTPLWTLSVDSTDSDSFYLWDETAGSYPFAVTPGGSSGLFVIDGANDRIGIGTSSPATALDVAGTVTANQVSLGDNEKAIFGAGSDLQIYHTGANSIIADNGAGKLILSGNGTAIDIYDNANAQTMASFTNNGAVTVGYQGSTKLATTSTGIDVTGNAEISGDLTVDTSTLHVDASTNRVGVRNTSPNAPLHVTGATRVQNVLAGREGFLEMYSGSGAGTGLWTLSIDSTDSNAFYLWDEQNSSYPFAVKPGGNSGTLVVDGSTDRVGIATTSPATTLEVATGHARAAVGTNDDNVTVGGRTIDMAGFEVVSTSGRSGFVNRIANDFASVNVNSGFQHLYPFSNGNDAYAFRASVGTTLSDTFWVKQQGTAYFSGNVGIGTTSPAADLHIADNYATLRLEDTDGTDQYGEVVHSAGVTSIDSRDGASDGEIRFRGQGGGSTTVYARFTSAGDFGINTGSPDGKLDVNGTVFFPAVNTTSFAGNARISPTTGEVLRNTSSIRYKTDVEDASDTISEAIVYGSRPVWYRSLAEADPGEWSFWGFIAEELHEVDPRLVDYAEDENGDLTPDGVQYDRFVVHLVNVAQQQKAKIDDLESRLSALEA